MYFHAVQMLAWLQILWAISFSDWILHHCLKGADCCEHQKPSWSSIAMIMKLFYWMHYLLNT